MPTPFPRPPGYDILADSESLAPRGLVAHARALGLAAAATAGFAALGVAWGQVERRLPAVRHVDVPLGPSRDVPPLTILQISDLHLYPGQEFLLAFLARVARRERVDFVLSTGDNLGSGDGVDLVRRAYAPFLDLPGAFVLGSNDYYSPVRKNWVHYLRRDPRVGDERLRRPSDLDDEFGTALPSPRRTWVAPHPAPPSPPAMHPVGPPSSTTDPHRSPAPGGTDREPGGGGQGARGIGLARLAPDLPWREVVQTFRRAGWVDLSNRAATVDVPVEGGARTARISLVGVDDPHLGRDRVPAPQESWEDPAALHLAVTHAPYLRVVDAFTRMGADLVVAGHTHGGQLGIPFMDPLVTNCDLPRHYGRGLHRWTSGTRSTWLNVSAGLGTATYVPLRIGARPDVTVMHIHPGA